MLVDERIQNYGFRLELSVAELQGVQPASVISDGNADGCL